MNRLTTADRLVLALQREDIGARADHHALISARIERRLQFGEHGGEADDLLARQIAAAARKNLIGEEQRRNAGFLESLHHLADIVDAAETRVGIGVDRDVHGVADARIMIGEIAHVGLAGVGLAEQAARCRITARHHGLETLLLDDARREPS